MDNGENASNQHMPTVFGVWCNHLSFTQLKIMLFPTPSAYESLNRLKITSL